MKCRFCSREIADNSMFCNWCGKQQSRPKKQKDEIRIPKPRHLPSGSWTVYLAKEKATVTEATEALCRSKALAVRAGFLEAQKQAPIIKKTVGELIDDYIASKDNILSPSTLRTYKHIRKYRFQSMMGKPAADLTHKDVQSAVNADAAESSSKTLRNAWGLVHAACCEVNKDAFQSVALPPKKPKTVCVYESEDLKKLFEAIKGDDAELAILLAACLGLRRSEILALRYDSFDRKKKTVCIDAARVPNEKNELVQKCTKTEKSMRTLPCPKFVIDKVPKGKTGYIYGEHKQNYLLERLKRICAANGLPSITMHGLRHTNASIMLALNVPDKYAMERGGWSSNQTMKNIYQHTLGEERKKADASVNQFFENLATEKEKTGEA